MKDSTVFVAFITALALHLILGAVLLMGFDFSALKDKPQKPVIINASMVNQKLFDDLAKKKAQIKADELAESQRKADKIRQEQARLERERLAEVQRRKDAEIKRVQAEKAERARVEKEKARVLFEKKEATRKLKAKQAAEKAKKIADAKRIKKAARLKAEKLAAEEARKAKLAAEKAQQEKRAKIEAEKKRKEAEAQAERLRQVELDKQMEAEFESEFSDAQSSKELSEITRYKALIQDKISRNWQLDPSMNGKSCTLAIRLASNGLVLSVNRSQGDQKVCDSAKRATFAAKTLPIPKDPNIALQFRDFDITLEPDF